MITSLTLCFSLKRVSFRDKFAVITEAKLFQRMEKGTKREMESNQYLHLFVPLSFFYFDLIKKRFFSKKLWDQGASLRSPFVFEWFTNVLVGEFVNSGFKEANTKEDSFHYQENLKQKKNIFNKKKSLYQVSKKNLLKIY